MKEKLKTLALLILILWSISMTREIWLDLPEISIGEAKTSLEEDESKNLNKIIRPNKYLLSFSDKEDSIFVADQNTKLWEEGKQIMEQVYTSKNIQIKQIDKLEYRRYENLKYIEYYFPYDLNNYILCESLAIKPKNDLVTRIPKLNRIYIYLGEMDPFLILSIDDYHYIIKSKNLDREGLKAEFFKTYKSKSYINYYPLSKIINTEKKIYLPYLNKIHPARVYLDDVLDQLDDNEKNTWAEKVLDKNITYIKEVVEENNSHIYIYNDSIYKLSTSGSIEYFKPLEERVLERNLYQSLNTAANFLEKLDLIDKNIHLSKIEKIDIDGDIGYKFIFNTSIGGLDLLIDKGKIEGYIVMEVFNSQVRSFLNHARKASIDKDVKSPKMELIQPMDIIENNYKYLEKIFIKNYKEEVKWTNIENQVLSSIEDIRLLYYDPKNKTRRQEVNLVWSIKILDIEIGFNAYNGDFIYKLD